ncbi:hypothetical protein GCM10009604_04680 [Corynebacterium aurimucosum]|uniref:hypothetical protein n=1 Tax=Corynebacterium aurimucosum TaxID=169292 RepID=UPI00191DF445|nr:hypothetical protein [Corynebacterium aurimucosum]QQU94465.1 hypothetical protein I6I66_06490 [Corynebacterium aurimucosum]UTA72639.1 hypothetical protein J3S22_06205 [Corynebacterium aurimucosum]WJY70974.1 hypothetical protein CAURIM_09375 [Corynebacterium aurimucosum]
MNAKQKQHYRARMAVAQLFRSFLDQGGERGRLMEHLGVETMPVIVPALGDTLACDIREAANRQFKAGAEHVVIPVCMPVNEPKGLHLCILINSTHDAQTFWKLDMNEIHGSVEMAQVVEALDPSKKWDTAELDSKQQQELKDLADLV